MTGSILYIPMSHPTDADFSLNTDLVQGVFPGALKTFSFDQGYKLFGLQVNFFSITILKAYTCGYEHIFKGLEMVGAVALRTWDLPLLWSKMFTNW